MTITLTTQELIDHEKRILGHFAKGMEAVGEEVSYTVQNVTAEQAERVVKNTEARFKLLVAADALHAWLKDNPAPRLLPQV